MSQEITVEKRQAQTTVSTRFECASTAMGDHFEKMLPPVYAYIEAQNGEIVGPPFVRYHAIFDNRFHLEVGLPVAEPMDAKAMMECNELPAGHAVVTTHVGPYKKLGKTHRAVRDWIRDHEEWTPAGAAWDFYLRRPDDDDDELPRTKVFYPVERTE